MTNQKTNQQVAYYIVALDAGMGALKVYGEKGGIELPAQIAVDDGHGIGIGLTGIKTKKPPMRVMAKGRGYYVGLHAHDFGREIENMTFEKLTGTPDMQALVYGALTQYQLTHGAFGETPIRMVIGLPNQMLTDGPEKIQKLRATIANWLIGAHEWQVDGAEHTAVIESISITSQSVGAYYDWLLDDKGKVAYHSNGRSKAMAEETGILSIGFNTGEAAVIRNNVLIQNMTKGKKVGVRRLLEIFMASQGRNLYTRGELDARIRESGVAVMQEAFPIWWGEVNDFIGEAWQDRHGRFSRIVLVGGGSLLLADYLKVKFDGCTIHTPPNPVQSISHGLYKLLLNQDKKKSE